MKIPAKLHPAYRDCVAIDFIEGIDQKALDEWGHGAEPEIVSALERLPGRFWKVGLFNDQPCYKSDNKEDPLFLFYTP